MNATITADQLRNLSDFLSDNTDIDFREDDELGVFRTYSGRGMYGKECVGIVVSGSAMFELAFGLADWIAQAQPDWDLGQAFKHPSTDSMGYDTIVYWPSIGLAEDEADEIEDDDADGMKAEAWADEVRPH